jgi:CoA:oxalate CoA-transferase
VADRATWFSHRDAIKQQLQQDLLAHDSAHWLAVLEPAGVWCAQVMRWPELAAHPAFEALGMTQTIRSASGATLRTTRCPIRLDGRRLFSEQGAPRLGADTEAIARELGLPPA